MPIEQPLTLVRCDGCGYSRTYPLSQVATDLFTSRFVGGELRREGWVHQGDKVYCRPACAVRVSGA